MKVSVKGSQDGGWGLIQNYKSTKVTYVEAAELWARSQSPKIIYCLVQFKDVKFGECPRVYLRDRAGDRRVAQGISKWAWWNDPVGGAFVFERRGCERH